jgi:1-aminocyclopropane-1-carboxylate deaminase
MMIPSPLEELVDERLGDVRVFLKRDDLIDSEISGNKWRKLKYNLVERGGRDVVTFGGAYSNHVRAVAAAGRRYGFGTVGVIRGEEHLPLNPNLAYAVEQGMRLVYVDRTAYRRKPLPDGDFFVLPEGGSNAAAVRGCAEIPAEIDTPFDVICCPCGTGGTVAGIAAGLDAAPGARLNAGLNSGPGAGLNAGPGAGLDAGLGPRRRAIGFSALKGGAFLVEEIRKLQRSAGTVTDNWSVETEFHFGGFARGTPELVKFSADFRERHGVALESTYVAKMMYGLFSLIARGRFRPGTVVVAVVTG